MNIAMLQTMATNKAQSKPSAKQSDAAATNTGEFGSVFQTIMSKSNQPAKVDQKPTDSIAEEIESIISTDSLEELFEKLGIEMDEAGLFILAGDAETPVAVDELLTLENLSELLGLTEQQVVEMVEQLLGDAQQQTITDIWSLLEQAPAIVSEILAAIQGTQQKDMQPNELQQIVQLLKMAELLGNKTDMMYQQEQQLGQLKDLLQSMLPQVQQVLNTNQQEAPKVTFQQIVQQVTQQTGTKTEQETSTPVGLQQQQMAQTKTVSITLPAEKPAQSEALIKEIQNLLNRSQLSGQQGNMKLLLKLFPENLGQIRIELVQKDGVLSARLLASTALGKELLDNNINQLKSGLVAQNIQMDRIDIAQSLQDADRNARDQNFFNNFFRQQEQEDVEENEDDNEEEKVSFSDLLSEEAR
ncbi:flagellar hook-length control protein [Solibacillus sp. R5-41]|uniref:flagellar hook-length control protein FliK n=1 Tax=Solibacillus sp. R5-41 TaxID=2048654 RepID=UPI000C125051|nr:flagellar hook-length control protein FliK [Solibacillus sp. R5-41]ATP39355.1 flagellar hook-length control protein [Solibacillus sp. R5-41]